MQQRSITYRILAFFLACLVLFTSVGFSVDMHFCQGDFKSFSLIGKAKNCHELANQVSTCKHHKAFVQKEDICASEEKKDCCENKTILLDSDQDQQVQTSDFSLTTQVKQAATFSKALLSANELLSESDIHFARYKPPLIQRDIPILIQSFLL